MIPQWRQIAWFVLFFRRISSSAVGRKRISHEVCPLVSEPKENDRVHDCGGESYDKVLWCWSNQEICANYCQYGKIGEQYNIKVLAVIEEREWQKNLLLKLILGASFSRSIILGKATCTGCMKKRHTEEMTYVPFKLCHLTYKGKLPLSKTS